MKGDPEKYIAKADLEHGAYYRGRCRNAKVARWNDEKGMFYHWRDKFGWHFIETIMHPEDDDVFDVFFPFEEIDNLDDIEEIKFPEDYV